MKRTLHVWTLAATVLVAALSMGACGEDESGAATSSGTGGGPGGTGGGSTGGSGGVGGDGAGGSGAGAPQDFAPPTGIPAPEFGIDESHERYEGELFDFGNGPEPYPDAGNGPYTHYVDVTAAGATDTNNPYGTPELPRVTIPQGLPAGSVVEVHHGPYGYAESMHGGEYLPIVDAAGTADQPIFIRGASQNDRFEIGTLPGNNEVLFRNVSYLIVENALVNGPALKIYQPSDHLALRHSEVTGEGSSGILLWTWKTDFSPGDVKQHIVIYGNDIHDNGEYPASAETGMFGIMIDNATENVWVLDNAIYHNGDDGIQVIDRDWVPEIADIEANRIFVGRNLMYEDGENAIDVKGSRNVIISQNEIYGYQTLFSSSAGEAIRINDEGAQDQIWVIYNHIYDSVDGVDPVGALFHPYVVGNVIHDCSGYGVNGDATVVTHNTIYNCGTGVDRRAAPDFELSNNIIVASDVAYEDCTSCGTDVIFGNLLHGNGTSHTCTGCSYDDPLLRDPAGGDYGLQDTSPAIDAVTTLSSVYDLFDSTYGIDIRVDFDGTPRPQGSAWDIGAFEHGAAQ